MVLFNSACTLLLKLLPDSSAAVACAAHGMLTIYDTAAAYLALEVNDQCKREIEDHISKENENELHKLLTSRLAFGTAGLRGPMGAGYCRMNDLVIIQTSQGLAKYLEMMFGTEVARSRGVIIGYDHRRYGTLSSEGFARVSAAVFLSLGFKVYCLEGYVPTPFVAFGVLARQCVAGIMVTASHNPKRDNGFKVYWDNGSQIIPPRDVGIASCIDDNLTPWQRYEYSDKSKILSNPLAEDVTETIAAEYYASIKSLCRHGVDGDNANGSNKVSLVYTAMHGVGYPWIQRAFETFGHAPVVAVPAQALPDPEFSTVVFPNPEEKGALDEAMRFADSIGAGLIVANDPDADRLAVAERQPEGGWHVLSGNEIGALLGYWQIVQHRQGAGGVGGPVAVLASVVSSRMLKKIALTEGLQYCDTLTGFKWLGNKASELKAQGVQVLLSYEEALGFCVGDIIFDKDGVSAAAVFVEMVACLPQLGCSSVLGLLQLLSKTYGDFVSYNSYVICHDAKVTDDIFSRIRAGGKDGGYWDSCSGQEIVCVKDITRGYDSSSADFRSEMPATPEAHMIMFEFANGCNVTLRTSGTEPKIKFYTEMCTIGGQSRAEVAEELKAFVDSVVEDMLQPSKWGLAKPS